MSKELAVELVKQGGGLLGALVWASLALGLVLLFRKQIVALLEGRDLSFEGLGVKVAVSRAAKAEELVRAAEAKARDTTSAPVAPRPPSPPARPTEWLTDPFGADASASAAPPPAAGSGVGVLAASAPADQRPPAAVVSGAVAPQVLDVLLDRTRARAIGRKRVLWVDDNPGSVANEAGAFRELGIQVDHATDTDGALERLQTGVYDLVISDLARGGENEAGLILMRTMRADNIDTPVVIYTSAHSARLTQGAKAAGAVLVTSSPTTLFETVVRRLAA